MPVSPPSSTYVSAGASAGAAEGEGLRRRLPPARNFAEAAQRPIDEPLGSPGFFAVGGYVRNDEVPKLQGAWARYEFRDMARRFPVAVAVLRAIKMIILSTKWEVVMDSPVGREDEARLKTEHPAGQEAIRYIQSVFFDDMNDMSFQNFVEDALEMLVYGWGWHEVTYKRRLGPESKYQDGLLGVREIALRPQTTLYRWDFTEDAKVRGMWQYGTTGRTAGLFFVPKARSLHTIAIRDQNNPEGRSLLRGAWEDWNYIKNLGEMESIGLEADLSGRPVFEIPSAIMDRAASGDKTAQKILQDWSVVAEKLRTNQQGSLILPNEPFRDSQGNPTGLSQYRVSLLGSAGGNYHYTSPIIVRRSFDAASTMLADFIQIGGSGGHGSYALEYSKRDFFETSVAHIMYIIADVLNVQVIPKLWSLNRLPPEFMPHIKPGRIRPQDGERLAGMLHALAATGMALFPDENLEMHVRELLNLPPPKPGTGLVTYEQMQAALQEMVAESEKGNGVTVTQDKKK